MIVNRSEDVLPAFPAALAAAVKTLAFPWWMD